MKHKISHSLAKILDALAHAGELPEVEQLTIEVTRPKDDQFGDYTTNIALILGKMTGKAPREIAERVKHHFAMPEVERVEIAGPGHLNFYLTQTTLADTLKRIGKEQERFGNSMLGDGVKVNNEFISANPTGPLHLGNGRGGFYADTLSRVLLKAGYDVTNEYYINDAGEQVVKLGHSVLKDAEAVYAGEYIDLLHEKFGKEGAAEEVGRKAAAYILENMIQPTTEHTMRVEFDVWTSEKKLVEDGYIERAIEKLKEKELTYEKDGALWLKTTDFGDDKDRVLVKQDGVKTYFASDCGYILNKMERGFTEFIETWGADHHGYISRFRAAAEMLGFNAKKIHFVIVQLVKLVKDGQEVRMSKRAGNVVTIDELIERVGHDVARFFFLMYSPDTHMNFDLGLAEERSEKNPVYYVQYAHARLANVLKKGAEKELHPVSDHLELLTHPKERALLRELLAFPELIQSMAEEKLVHPLPQYAIRLADRLHSFYAECQVVDEANRELSGARLSLILGIKTVLAEALRIMGITAPDRM